VPISGIFELAFVLADVDLSHRLIYQQLSIENTKNVDIFVKNR